MDVLLWSYKLAKQSSGRMYLSSCLMKTKRRQMDMPLTGAKVIVKIVTIFVRHPANINLCECDQLAHNLKVCSTTDGTYVLALHT